MDYEAVRAGMQQAIPYNNHLGLEVVEVADGRGVVRLPESDSLLNHVASQHAGALFSAGEAASGAAFVGGFAEQMGSLTPLARSASIEYRKLARGPDHGDRHAGRGEGRRCSRGWTPTGRSSSRSTST